MPKASPLTLTGVTKGPRNKKQKGIVELEAEPTEENDNREIETVLEQIPPAEEEEMPLWMSPLSQSGPELREDFPELAKSSRKDAENIEIIEMMRLINKDIEERKQKRGKRQQIREEFLEAEFRRKEQLLEYLVQPWTCFQLIEHKLCQTANIDQVSIMLSFFQFPISCVYPVQTENKNAILEFTFWRE